MLNDRPHASLPSTTEVNPREHLNAITLRNGKKLNDPAITYVGVIDQPKSMRDKMPEYMENKLEKEIDKPKSKLIPDNPPPHNPPIPFP